GCARQASGPDAKQARLPDRIVIGATLPIGSAEGQTARFYREGYELAVEQANRAGGVGISGKRVPVALEILDDGGDPSRAAAQIKTLVEEKKAAFLLGSANGAVVEAQSAVAEARRIPYVTGFGESKALFARGFKYLFGLQAPVQLLAYTQMRWI